MPTVTLHKLRVSYVPTVMLHMWLLWEEDESVAGGEFGFNGFAKAKGSLFQCR